MSIVGSDYYNMVQSNTSSISYDEATQIAVYCVTQIAVFSVSAEPKKPVEGTVNRGTESHFAVYVRVLSTFGAITKIHQDGLYL